MSDAKQQRRKPHKLQRKKVPRQRLLLRHALRVFEPQQVVMRTRKQRQQLLLQTRTAVVKPHLKQPPKRVP